MQQLAILFLLTFGAAFLASLPPGLLNMNAAKTSVEKGKGNGVIFGLGVAIAVAIQTYIAVRIAKYIVRHPEVIDVLLQIALVVFALFAVFFFVKGKKQSEQPLVLVEGKKRSSFSKGFFLAAVNILAIPYYSGLNTLFHTQGFMTYRVLDEIIYIFSAGGGTFLAMYIYVFYFNKMERKTNAFSKNSNYILSGLMLLLFILTCLRRFN
jgi:threonine/homoserine/homoserine lactone efflux protein